MTFSTRSILRGTRLAAVTFSIATMTLAGTSFAQEKAADANVDPNVFNLFLESRTQKPAGQATTEERDAAMLDLTNIYLVTNLPAAEKMGEDPRVKAQLELQRRGILFNSFANDFLASNAATDQEIFDAYEEQVALAPPKEFKARHILVESQGQALDLIKELQGGADFIELAKNKSTGPSGPNGGDLGWFAPQAMVQPFSEAVAAMEDGAITTVPVQTQFGWHVILREDSRDGTAPPLDSVRDVIKQRVEQDKFQNFMKGLR